MTARTFAWNWNNYPEDYKEVLLRNMKGYKYICFGEEIAPTTGTPHIQGYVRFNTNRMVSGTRKKNVGLHIDIAFAGDEANRKYCSKTREKDEVKNEVFYEDGEMSKQGDRRDIEELRDRIVEGERVDDIIMETPAAGRMEKCLDRMENIVMRKRFRTEMTTCDWLWGGTGVGKSHEAYKDFNPETCFNFPDDNGWWDNYRQQETVIINEFRGNIKLGELLKLIDKWPHEVKRRNKPPLPFTSKHIIITSCFPPSEIYKHCGEKIDQLLRRVLVKEILSQK